MKKFNLGFFAAASFLFCSIIFTNTVVASSHYGAKIIGGSDVDMANVIRSTADGGYIVGGSTESFGAGYKDMWMMKFDSGGTLSWQKTYGVWYRDSVESVQQTADGGFIMAGESRVIKLDASGNIIWQKSYGVTLYSICQDADGGYIAAGGSCVLKLSATGTVAWAKKYSDSADYYAVRQTTDSGYIICGRIGPIGAGIVGFMVLKITADGDLVWQKSYGSSLSEYAYSVLETADGGYIAAGTRYGSAQDILVLKLAANGDITWQRIFSRSSNDTAYSVLQPTDGGYVVAGYSTSWIGGKQHEDVVVFKLAGNGSLEWQKLYGSGARYMARSISLAADGGYLLSGTISNSGELYEDGILMKISENGAMPNCSLMKNGDFAVTASSIVPVAVTVPAQTLSVTATNTSVAVSNSAAAVSTVCDADVGEPCLIGGLTDTDCDGAADAQDNCPAVFNPYQADSDGDGIGDACDIDSMDSDGDAIGDAFDNCPGAYNPDQADMDNDGAGDACDTCPHDALNDTDQDGVCGDVDNCSDAYNPGQADSDGDGVGDACDSQAGWTYAQIAADMMIQDLWGTAPSDIYVCGNSGLGINRLFHYDGQSWSEMSLPSNMGVDLVALWGTSSTNIYMSGFLGGIWHYNGSSWNQATTLSSTILGIWGSSDQDIFATGSYNSSAAILHYNGSSWARTSISGINQLLSVWGSSGSDLYAVGSQGSIVHYDGLNWQTVESNTSNYLHGIWGSSGSDVYAVGDYGTIKHYDGTAWSRMASPTSNTLYSIWGSSASDIYAVGDRGTVLHYDGAAWSLVDISTLFPPLLAASQRETARFTTLATTSMPTLKSIWGASSADVYAGGDSGTVLHFGEGTLTTTTTTTTSSAPPTVVELASFTATPSNRAVILEWQTASEIDNFGFNLYRAVSEDGDYVKINAALIPSKGTSTQGAAYEFVDRDVKNRKTYWYKIEDIDVNGTSTFHGPVSATPRVLLGIR